MGIYSNSSKVNLQNEINEYHMAILITFADIFGLKRSNGFHKM